MNRRFSSNRRNTHGIGRGQIGESLRPRDWSQVQLPAVQPLQFQPSNSIPHDETAKFRKEAELRIEGENIPAPLRSFEESNFPSAILTKFQQMGFQAPTPIQAQSWPMILSGRDVLGIAETGSGKTLGFALPGVIHIQNQPRARRSGPICLCVAPTRELAIQIETETKKFASSLGITVASCYGGAPRHRQQSVLRRGVDFLIATPGRLLDFLERRVIDLTHTSYVVFDEADRMLDMGFEPQIRAVMSQVRPDRQMLMFSATWPKEVEALARQFLKPTRCAIKVGDENKACERVTQQILITQRHAKPQKLFEILQTRPQDKTIIFTATKRMADRLAGDLRRAGFRSDAIHGDKDQRQRERSLDGFKRGYTNILVATDVASRGLDVKDLTLVINFDFPKSLDDYIHRIGRTGRAGKFGTAISFFDGKEDGKNAKRLVSLLAKNNQDIPEELRSLASRSFGKSKYGRSNWRRERNSSRRDSFRPYKQSKW